MNIGLLVMGAVIVAGVVRAARTLFGRQVLRARRLGLRLVISLLAGAAVLLTTIGAPETLLGDAVGLGLGIGLALLAVRLTVFDRSNGQTYYLPNSYVSALVLALFIFRIVYRIASIAPTLSAIPRGGGAAAALASSRLTADPLSAAAFFLMIGYYICYCTALLLRARATTPTPPGVATP